MSVKVFVREGESVANAVRRLNLRLKFAVRRQWHKSRPGYHVKRSDRRRRRESLKARNALRTHLGKRRAINTVYLTPRQLWLRHEPFEPIAKEFKMGTHGGQLRRWRTEQIRRRRAEIEEMRAIRELV